MFRDTYKAANCDITPDSKLLAQTLSRIEQAEKKPAVIPIRAIGACAAALAVMVGSVFGYMRYNEAMTLDVAPKVTMADTANKSDYDKAITETDDTIGASTVPDTVDDEHSAPTGDTVPSATEQIIADTTVAKTTTSDLQQTTKTTKKALEKSTKKTKNETTKDSAQIQTPTAVHTEPVPSDALFSDNEIADASTDTSVSATTNSEIEVTSRVTDNTPPADAEAIGNNQPISGGGGGGSASFTERKAVSDSVETDKGIMSADIAYNEAETDAISDENSSDGYYTATDYPSEITYGEYCEYIGHDLYEELAMPDDVIAEIWTTTEFSTDNDEVTLTYKSTDSRYAEVTPTKDTQKIYNSINISEAEKKTADSAISYSKDNATAYIVNGDIGYTVKCVGFDEKEFAVLTESIPD